MWSPGSAAELVGVVADAKASVDFASEELADRRVIAALAAAARRGVSCRVVMNDDPQWAGAFAKIVQAGCEVRTYPESDTGLYVHEKTAVADGRDAPGSATVLVGSMNATATSLDKNRELAVRFDPGQAPAIAKEVESVFDRDFDGGGRK